MLFPDGRTLIIVPAAPISIPGDHLGLLLLLVREDGAWEFGTEVVWRFAGQ